MNDPIPAIREDDATGETAALFTDVRTTLGVPFVNLIWRHLATMPGMLAWTWSVVKPMHGTWALHRAVDELRTGVVIPAGIRQPQAVFDAAGVAADHRQMIGAMLRYYNSANAANLLGLLLVQSILAGERPALPASENAARRSETRATLHSLPPLLGLAEMAPSLRDLVLQMDQFGRLDATDAVASLYRHLAHWPGFLAIAHAALSIPHRASSLAAEHKQTRRRARSLMLTHLMPLSTSPPLPPEPGRAAAQSGMRTFTEQMIGRMVFMGEVMLALLPSEAGYDD